MCAWLLIWKAAKLKKPTNYLLYYSSLRKGIIGSFGHFKLLNYPPLPPPTSHFFGNKTVSLQLNYFLLFLSLPRIAQSAKDHRPAIQKTEAKL